MSGLCATLQQGVYHVRMCRKPSSAAGPPIESGWVTATSFAAIEEQAKAKPAEMVVDVDVIISCITTLIEGSAKDKLRTYFALYLSEDTSTTAFGSARCINVSLLPRFFDTIATHYAVPALTLEQLARDAAIVLKGGPDPLLDGQVSATSHAHASSVSTGSKDSTTFSTSSSLIATLTWDWLWRACELTKDLNEIVSQPRLFLRSLTRKRGSERVERAHSVAAVMQAQHAASLSPGSAMKAGNVSSSSIASEKQKSGWKERSRRRAQRAAQCSLQRPSRMSGSTRYLASPNNSYGTMATWELLEEDTDLREERLAQETAEASNDSGYIPGLSTMDTYVETIGPPVGLDRTGRRSLTSYKEKQLATASKFVTRDEQMADPSYTPSMEESMQAAVRQWHSMELIH